MATLDETHAPGLRSWAASADSHAEFPVQNLLLGSGAISGPAREAFGALPELTECERRPRQPPGGDTRRILEDRDVINMRARTRREGFVSIGPGECCAKVSG